MKWKIVWLIVVAWGLTAVAANEKDFGPEYHELTDEVVTPHVDWAPRYEKGPLRMFSIGHTAHQRDAIELKQRFPMELSHLFTERFGFGYKPGNSLSCIKGASREDRLKRFRSLIDQEMDVIVPDGQFMFEVYPDEVTYKILDKVRKGAGLVIFTHWNRTGDGAPKPVTKRRPEIDRILYEKGEAVEDTDHFLSTGVPFKGLTAWKDLKDADEFEGKMIRRQFGKGRILILTGLFPPAGSAQASRFTPSNTFDGDYADYFEREYYYAFAMKALLWAAGKRPDILLKSFKLLSPNGKAVDSVAVAEVSQSEVELLVTGKTDPETRVQWTVRNKTGKELATSNSRFTDDKAVLRLPELPRGSYYVDAVIRRGEVVVNWGTIVIKVTSELYIADLTCSRKSVEPGNLLSVDVELSRPASATMAVQLSVTGNFDRLLIQATKTMPPGHKHVAFQFVNDDRISRLLTIGVKLKKDGRVIDDFRSVIPMRLPVVKDHFQTLIWTGVSDDFSQYAQACQLANLGFDYLLVGYQGFNPLKRGTDQAVIRAARAANSLNFGQWAYVDHFFPKSQENNIRVPCLTNPEFHNKQRKQLATFAEILKDYGVMYMLGDENCLQTPRHDLCFSPTCVKSFQEYVKGVYQDLESLNREWGTALQAWEEVKPLDLKTARKENQPARWVDHRTHMSRVWVDMFRKCQNWIREIDPGALVGLDYTCPAHGDFGEVEMARDLSILTPEPNQILGEATRSLMETECFKGSWALWGFHLDRGPGEGHKIWDSFLRDSALCCVFGARPGDCQSYMTADLRPYSYFKEPLAEAEVVKHGLDKLLLPLRDNVEVAIVFSETIQFAGRFHEIMYDHRNSYFAFRDRLWKLGVNCHLLPLEDIVGSDAMKKYRMVILPGCCALTQQQADKMADYVASGGTLLADLRPGVMDGHGKPLEKGLLDETFGVVGPVDVKSVGSKTVEFTIDDQSYRLDDAMIDESLRLTTGVASGTAGKIPVLIRDHVDEGLAALLNLSAEFSFNGVNEDAGNALLKALLLEAGVWIPVTTGRANNYSDGENEYVVVVDKKPTPCVVKFKKPCHLYDGRQGEYLGHSDSVTIDLAGSEGRWISGLPYRVEGIVLEGPAVIRRGERFAFTARLEIEQSIKPGRHVFFVAVHDPEGRECRYYRQKIVAENGGCDIVIPFCLNEKAGEWTITVTDVATGSKAGAKVKIEA